MAQKEIEVILTRQLASCLATPVFIVDAAGTLIYYNEAAEELLGRRYDEAGEMPAEEWGSIFRPTGRDGTPIPPEDLPLTVAFREGRPAHRDLWIRGLDGVDRHVGVTAFPLIGQAGRHLGAVCIFWETTEGGDSALGNPRVPGGTGS